MKEQRGLGTFSPCPQLKELRFTDALTGINDEDVFTECDNLTVCGPAGSYIEPFANENGILFEVE